MVALVRATRRVCASLGHTRLNSYIVSFSLVFSKLYHTYIISKSINKLKCTQILREFRTSIQGHSRSFQVKTRKNPPGKGKAIIDTLYFCLTFYINCCNSKRQRHKGDGDLKSRNDRAFYKHVKFRGVILKCLSEFINLSLGANIRCTFRRATHQAGTLGIYTVSQKSSHHETLCNLVKS